VRQLQFVSQRRLRDRRLASAVRDGDDAGGAEPQIPAQVLRQAVGDCDDWAAQRGRETQGNAPPPTLGVVTAAVHGENVRGPRAASCPCPVYGHGELVTVG